MQGGRARADGGRGDKSLDLQPVSDCTVEEAGAPRAGGRIPGLFPIVAKFVPPEGQTPLALRPSDPSGSGETDRRSDSAGAAHLARGVSLAREGYSRGRAA